LIIKSKQIFIAWFKETTVWWFTTLFGKIGILFSIAAFVLLVSAYYVFSLSFTESDNILDAHDAYYHYKLVSSWGNPPDKIKLAEELSNLKLNGAIFKTDQDTLCENDTLAFWTNFNGSVDLCDYISYSDSEDLGTRHNIVFPSYVSFGDFYYLNEVHQAALVEYKGFQYLLTIGSLEPNFGFSIIPLIILFALTLLILYLLVRRFLKPISIIEKRMKALEKGDLDSKIETTGKDELAILSNNLNRIIQEMKTLLNQKERLLSDVSHELRTPLAKIRLLLTMINPEHVLSKSGLKAKLKQLGINAQIESGIVEVSAKIAKIDKHIKTIDSLITNILLSDKMASPYSNLNLKNISLKSLIDEAVDMTFVKNVQTDFELDKNTIVSIDNIKMAIAIKNLLENAYKYSGDTENILIKVFKKDGLIHTAVIDRGPGIKEDEAEKLKKAFVRGSGRPNSSRGFGLGLSICNKVILAHGGTLLIKNNQDVGSTFTLAFPLNKK